jgi:NAD(P) transhydrogenase subunit alpha
MRIGTVKERPPEKRVAVVPENVKALKDLNLDVMIEKQAGVEAFQPDASYAEAGAVIAAHNEVLGKSDILLFVNHPTEEELQMIPSEGILIGCFGPYTKRSMVEKLVSHGITTFSMELLPRTTLAQSMDVLSSMALIAGYKAVLEAAVMLPSFFPMFMTAAGTIKPARMLVLGAGVAGLQAVATGRRLGARVEAFDVRSASKEEVISLGGKFIEVEGSVEEPTSGGYAVEQTQEYMDRQAEMIHQHALRSNVIICTAQIPGKRAPLLLRKETVTQMEPGSVIVDLAASTGGNCELARDNETVICEGVRIVGQSSYPVEMPYDASKMFGNNLISFVRLITGSGEKPNLDWDNEIIRETCLTHDGKIINSRIDRIYNEKKEK